MKEYVELALERWAEEYNRKWESRQFRKCIECGRLFPVVDPRRNFCPHPDGSGKESPCGSRYHSRNKRKRDKDNKQAQSWDEWLKANQHIPSAKALLARSEANDAKA